MKKKLLILTTVLALVAGCVSSNLRDIRVEAEADTEMDFSGYSSYAWLGSAAIVYDPDGRWESPEFDADSEIEFLIDRELRKRGLAENSSSPDLVVAYAAGIDMDSMEIVTDPADSNLTETLQNVPMGALVVVLIDVESGLAVWAGVATAEIQQNPDQKLIRQRLDYAVSSMFKKLPK